LDRLFVPLDKTRLYRTQNLRLIPWENDRRGGKHSYAEWAHVIGIFQTLLCQHLDTESNAILDVGCGTGLLAIASEPFLGDRGRYVGLDVVSQDIAFCRAHYPARFHFALVDARNATYAPLSSGERRPWDLDAESFDMVTSLSVWTHMAEEDARFYMKEVRRVLRPGGKALITMFVLDEAYQESLSIRSSGIGRYHMKPQDRWIFDQNAYGSEICFHPKWARVPEDAIGITRQGLDDLLSQSELKTLAYYPGNWKEIPGMYFQDVVVVQRAG
jgi:SAM-dependent methyltransferase